MKFVEMKNIIHFARELSSVQPAIPGKGKIHG